MGLLKDPSVGQRLLQFGDTRVGDLGSPKLEFPQVGQTFEMHQPGGGDLGVGAVDFNNLALIIRLDTGTELHQLGNGIGVDSLSRQVICRRVPRFMRRIATTPDHTPPHQSLYWWRLELLATFRELAEKRRLEALHWMHQSGGAAASDIQSRYDVPQLIASGILKDLRGVGLLQPGERSGKTMRYSVDENNIALTFSRKPHP